MVQTDSTEGSTVEETYGIPHVKTWLPRMLLSHHKLDLQKKFIAHWQAYHIDQHTSQIVCEHEDCNLCQYMTDRESDMKSHIHNLHRDVVAKKQANNSYLSENAWLDLTSSWSIKDLEINFLDF